MYSIFKSTEIETTSFFKKRRNIPCGNEIATRRKWWKNTAGW